MKNKNTIKSIAFVLIFSAVLGIIAFGINTKIAEAKSVKEKQEQESLQAWLSDNCDCVERERLKCRWSGFELEGRRCVNKEDGTFTNVVLGCSQYMCSEAVYNFNENKWELNKTISS